MSNKKYLGAVLVFIPILLILITLPIFFNDKDTIAGEEDWTNITEVSEEFLDKYFDDYEAMREETEPENILMVTSKARPETYGAVSVVEAPNYLYMLSYTDAAARDVAFENLTADGVMVEKNQMYNLMEEIPANKENKSNKIMSEEQLYKTMGTGEESDRYLSWGMGAMALGNLHNAMDELDDLPTVTVAVIDSGMDPDSFNASKFSESRTVYYHCVAECGDGEMRDGASSGHGTHVGGTVMDGTLDNVELLVIKSTCNADGQSWTSDNTTAVNYAVANNADVINMSFGGPGADTYMYNALQAAEEAGVINVAAAGNDNVSTLYYPASHDNVLSIAALRAICEDDYAVTCKIVGLEKADFSNYGEEIDFALPGQFITSINGDMSGTSQASPHMAAVVANLKSLNNDLTRANAKELLKDYSVDFGDEGWDQYYGWGMPNFYYIPDGFCTYYNCDDYEVFASHWGYLLDGLTNALSDGRVGFLITDRYLIVASDGGPVMAMSERDGEYTRIQAEETDYDNMKVFYFNETNPLSTIHMAFVGDVDLNGAVNVLDLAGVKRSILLPTSGNYQALSDKAKVLADITGDGSVNVLDLARIKRSILLTTSANYLPLSW